MTSERRTGRARSSAFVWGQALSMALVITSAAPAQAETRSVIANETFRYRSAQPAHYARAILEELIVLGGESLQYWKDRDINSADWDLGYDWSSFGAKLDGTAYSFDTNRFVTNFAYHPAAGTLYYLAPRSNHLGVLESLGYATAASTFWEVFAEFRERVSVNDMWVTPLSGLSLGETTSQLGAFFDRGCESRLNSALGWAFGPARSLHDVLDGAKLARASSCDAWGFETNSRHRFRLSLGAAQNRAHDGEWFSTSRARLETSILNLPDGEDVTEAWHGFADGNVSDMTLGLAYGPHDIQDMLIETRSTVAGAEFHRRTGSAGVLGRGDRVLFGTVVGMQYSLHRYRLRDPLDSVFLVDAPAVTVRWSGRRAAYGFELALDAGVTFGGMDALALAPYRQVQGEAGLTTIASQQNYNYVAGVALVPRARLELEGAELGLSMRTERVVGIRVLDRYAEAGLAATAPVTEQRRRGMLWVSVGPSSGARLVFSAEAGTRYGSVGASERAVSDLNLGLSLAAAL